jgi:hypothetical protein
VTWPRATLGCPARLCDSSGLDGDGDGESCDWAGRRLDKASVEVTIMARNPTLSDLECRDRPGFEQMAHQLLVILQLL